LACPGARVNTVGAHASIWGPDDSIYLTDDGGHFVRNVRSAARWLLELGVPQPAPISRRTVNRATHTALSPKGELYVSDGYCTPRFPIAPDGKNYCCRGASPAAIRVSSTSSHNICPDADGCLCGPTVRTTGPGIRRPMASTDRKSQPPPFRAGLYIDYIRHPVCYSALSVNRLHATSRARSASSTSGQIACRGSATRLPDGRLEPHHIRAARA